MSGGLPGNTGEGNDQQGNDEDQEVQHNVRISGRMQEILRKASGSAYMAPTSMTSVATSLVESNIMEVKTELNAVRYYVSFGREFSYLVGKDHDIPPVSSEFKMEDELEEQLVLSLDMGMSGILSEATNFSKLSKSAIVRACIIKGLHNVALSTDVDFGKRMKSDIKNVVYDVKRMKSDYKLKFKDYLVEWLGRKEDRVREVFESYPGKAEDFGYWYYEEFKGYDGYNAILEEVDEELFDRLEDIIEESSGIEE